MVVSRWYRYWDNVHSQHDVKELMQKPEQTKLACLRPCASLPTAVVNFISSFDLKLSEIPMGSGGRVPATMATILVLPSPRSPTSRSAFPTSPNSRLNLLSSTYCSKGKVQPANHTHFNNHPLRVCQWLHPAAVEWVQGCSVHNGCRDGDGKCNVCELEQTQGKVHLAISLRDKVGYPGDDKVAQFQD
jgi:hypothetical protein